MEPNSALGGAISYLLKHWEKLTLFLRVAGAPLDNNVCERALKKAILHRQECPLLQDLPRCPCGRRLHEPDSHLRTLRGQSVRLPDRTRSPRGRGGREPAELDALELPADARQYSRALRPVDAVRSVRGFVCLSNNGSSGLVLGAKRVKHGLQPDVISRSSMMVRPTASDGFAERAGENTAQVKRRRQRRRSAMGTDRARSQKRSCLRAGGRGLRDSAATCLCITRMGRFSDSLPLQLERVKAGKSLGKN